MCCFLNFRVLHLFSHTKWKFSLELCTQDKGTNRQIDAYSLSSWCTYKPTTTTITTNATTTSTTTTTTTATITTTTSITTYTTTITTKTTTNKKLKILYNKELHST